MPSYAVEPIFQESSLHEFLWNKILDYRSSVALIDCSNGNRQVSFREIYELSRKCTSSLQNMGVKKGDFISIASRNCIDFMILMLGILGSGATVTPCNPSYKKGEIIQQFKISEPKLVFVDEDVVATMKEVKEELSFLQAIFVVGESNEYSTLKDILNNGNDDTFQHVDINPTEDVAIVPYSSGTTGLPKAVMLTHKNCVAAATMNLFQFSWRKPDCHPTKCVYIDRPMYYAGGFMFVLMNMANGISCVYEQEFEVERMLKDIEKFKVDTVICVPPMMVALANFEGTMKHDLSSLRVFSCGGAAIAPDVIQRVTKKYNAAFVPDYGSTEAFALSIGTPGCDITSAGKISPGIEVKIVDFTTKQECPIGTDGEILVRGPIVTKGYMKNASATAEDLDEQGWFRMGDLGHIDSENNIYIVDRLKEIIKYKTLQISPAEIESVIIRHEKVADVGVVGIPDPLYGEVPRAFVQPNDQSLTKDDVIAVVEENLVEYKHLHGGVEFVDSIPKSQNGKILRRALKKMAGH